MKRIWITSDAHFCHNKEFLYEPRGFNTVWEMNEAIVTLHNEIVEPEDDVYYLGDMMLNDNTQGLKYIKQLKGNLHIVIGNHDTDERIKLYNECYNIVEVEYAYRLKYKKYHFFLTHYPTLCNNWDDGKGLKQKVINLCGHTHTKDPFIDWNKGTIFHCELDTNNCIPWLLDDIIEKLKEKYVEENN